MDSNTKSKIQSLKDSLGSLLQGNAMLSDDIYLLLWLKGHRMNVNRAEAAIREGVEWRKKNGIENILTEHLPKQLVSDMPLYIDGTSKTGIPVAYYYAGEARFSRIIRTFGREKVGRYWLQLALELETKILAANRARLVTNTSHKVTADAAHTCIAIVDIAGFTLRHLPSFKEIQSVLEIARECIKQFPVQPDLCMFINVNRAFQIPLRLIQPVLQGLGFSVKIYGTDESTWKEVLDLVDREQICALQSRAAMCSSALKNYSQNQS